MQKKFVFLREVILLIFVEQINKMHTIHFLNCDTLDLIRFFSSLYFIFSQYNLTNSFFFVDEDQECSLNHFYQN